VKDNKEIFHLYITNYNSNSVLCTKFNMSQLKTNHWRGEFEKCVVEKRFESEIAFEVKNSTVNIKIVCKF